MKIELRHSVSALIVALPQIAGTAYAQNQAMPVEPLVRPVTAAAKAPIQIKVPQDWIIYDDTVTFTPVVDDVSRHLNAARKAFDAKDNKKAAAEMRAVADALKLQAVKVDKEDRSLEKAGQALPAKDAEYARDSVARLNAGALKISSAADAIDNGKIRTQADLNKAIDTATRADMDRRWQVSDVTIWYPVSEEPQRLFKEAVASYSQKDYKTAATDIRKAIGYMRLEANRATGNARQELDRSIVQLDTLAASIEKGTSSEEQAMAGAFAKANQSLALEHRSKAAESWARQEYDQTGYELKAVAHGLDSAAGWIGKEAKASASATVADARALGDKLASGAACTRDEVSKGFHALDKGIDSLSAKIASAK